ncbi:hypothetical protein [Demequina aurantiaca]|uniref:hypothetical protein n=1 Tax=Demequina aurantiaca TaxID=676200 RepID=UPI003D34C134
MNKVKVSTPPCRLIAVDLENLLGVEPRYASDSCWEAALSGLLDSVQYREGVDRLVVGVGHDWVFTVADLAPASARIVTRDGVSGADLALCDELADTGFIARRFDEVIIGSGDHEFVGSVRALRAAGLATTVATIAIQASGELAFVADAVVWLERPAIRLGEYATIALAVDAADIVAVEGARSMVALPAADARAELALAA